MPEPALRRDPHALRACRPQRSDERFCEQRVSIVDQVPCTAKKPVHGIVRCSGQRPTLPSPILPAQRRVGRRGFATAKPSRVVSARNAAWLSQCFWNGAWSGQRRLLGHGSSRPRGHRGTRSMRSKHETMSRREILPVQTGPAKPRIPAISCENPSDEFPYGTGYVNCPYGPAN
jgi:hypothetical protein